MQWQQILTLTVKTLKRHRRKKKRKRGKRERRKKEPGKENVKVDSETETKQIDYPEIVNQVSPPNLVMRIPMLKKRKINLILLHHFPLLPVIPSHHLLLLHPCQEDLLHLLVINKLKHYRQLNKHNS